MTSDWKLEGLYFEACNCDAACPCVFLSPPTMGDNDSRDKTGKDLEAVQVGGIGAQPPTGK